MSSEVKEKKPPSKFIKLLFRLIVFLSWYVAPAVTIWYRHANEERKISIFVYIAIGLVIWLWAKQKHSKMVIKRNYQIEQDNRTLGNVLYFMLRFAIFYVIAYVMLNMVSFNFDSISATLEYIFLYLLCGALFRMRLVQVYKV